jgi:hypothetical protein
MNWFLAIQRVQLEKRVGNLASKLFYKQFTCGYHQRVFLFIIFRHIKQHLGSKIDVEGLNEQKQRFHYFKLHDLNKVVLCQDLLLGSRQDLDFNLGPRQDQKFIILVY